MKTTVKPLKLKREVLLRLPYQPPTMVNYGRTVDLIQGTGIGSPDFLAGERKEAP